MNYQKKLKWAEYYILFRMYYGRGYGHFAFVTDIVRNIVMGGVLIELVDRWTGYRIPLRLMIVAAFAQYFICFGLGWVEKIIGLWQFETNYSARKLSPWNDEILERIKNIEKNLDR